ncbi:MAG: glutamine synthetase [Gammaproteobacteria bacterium]|nr:MAG: glutamine synthetase [Gammaproteobacteria bacterium]
MADTNTKTGNWQNRLPEAALQWLDGRLVGEVECIAGDMAGLARGKAMPARKFAREDRLYMPPTMFYQTITGDYVYLDEIPDQWNEIDLVLTPDFHSATAVPWSSDIALQIIHDVSTKEGELLRYAPRNVLKRVLARYAEHGWQPIVAPELEFYLTKPNIDPDYPIEPPIGRTGRQGVARQPYSMSAVDEYGPVIDLIYDYAEAQGFEIDTIIQEGGAGQIEINLQHGDPVTLADQVFYYKRLIREAALKNDCFATFMAKPMEDQPGSAMHIHQSVIDIATGRNIFNDDKDQPTDHFNHYLGGLQTYAPAVVCIFAPYVNSYRRYRRNESAPINLEWSQDNRTVGLRVPTSSPEGRRIENRVVGMDTNPYLAIAASLACGLLGLEERLAPRPAFEGDAYALPQSLPRDILVAVEDFRQSEPVNAVLGEEFGLIYRAIKESEAAAFLEVISPWEREHLLLNV